jgi:hypothetical protein
MIMTVGKYASEQTRKSSINHILTPSEKSHNVICYNNIIHKLIPNITAK